MNDDQLYYFLVDKNTRNVLQIDYPSDIDEFNKILGTSEGKGSLLKDLGIILGSDAKVFKNPELIIKPVEAEIIESAPKVEEPVPVEKITKPKKKAAAKKVKVEVKPEQIKVNLFAGLFD